MCGIIGILLADSDQYVNQLLFDGLTVLQHRGQDAAGMVTGECSRRLHLRKDNGLVKDVFQQHHMIELRGNAGIGHCRYPTAGTSSCAEAQPLYTNYPYGICVAHNGNITNTEELAYHVRSVVGRHCNTESDSELLLNLFAEYLTQEAIGNNNNNSNNNNDTNGSNSHDAQANGQSSSTTKTTGSMLSIEDMKEAIFRAMTKVMTTCHGGYAGLILINGYGLVGFRDPYGIRPLVFGCRKSTSKRIMKMTLVDQIDADGIPSTPAYMESVHSTLDYVISSESVAIDTLGFKLVRDVRAGEAIFIDMEGNCHSRIVHPSPKLSPCIFEYVYFARPDSIMDGVSIYESRLKMGEKLADKLLKQYPLHDIDVVIPIPDTSRTSALQLAYKLDRPFREGFIKNRYIARTFIMPGQATRKKSVRLKLNTIKSEFAGKNVLLVDDSIVRGTTAKEIVQMARDAGAKKVFFSSAAPPIRYPNIYGIDIPTRKELIAYQRDEVEIAKQIGCDWVLYQDLHDLEECIREVSASSASMPTTTTTPTNGSSLVSSSSSSRASRRKLLLQDFDTSCFSGTYVTGERIGDGYFQRLHTLRNDAAKVKRERGGPASEDDDDDNNDNDNGRNDEHDNKRKKLGGSDNGCEILANDTNGRNNNGDSIPCEPITNDV